MTYTGHRWFWEERSMTGTWQPVTSPNKPNVSQSANTLRIKRVGSLGPRVRAMPVQVDRAHLRKELSELAAIYGQATPAQEGADVVNG